LITPSPWHASQRPALDVERKPPRLVPARPGLGQPGEPFADRGEGAGIGRRVAARRSPDRRLVDIDHLVEVLEALDAVMGGRCLRGAIEPSSHRLVERLDQQRRLAAAGHAADAGEKPERNLGGDLLEIVSARIDHLERAARIAQAALGDRNHQLAG
jgi:hypothetical protein